MAGPPGDVTWPWAEAVVEGSGVVASLRAATAWAVNPLNVIQRPTVSSQAAMGRVRKKAVAETWSMTPKRHATKAANSSGAPIRPTVGMMRGTRRER